MIVCDPNLRPCPRLPLDVPLPASQKVCTPGSNISVETEESGMSACYIKYLFIYFIQWSFRQCNK